MIELNWYIKGNKGVYSVAFVWLERWVWSCWIWVTFCSCGRTNRENLVYCWGRRKICINNWTYSEKAIGLTEFINYSTLADPLEFGCVLLKNSVASFIFYYEFIYFICIYACITMKKTHYPTAMDICKIRSELEMVGAGRKFYIYLFKIYFIRNTRSCVGFDP